MEGYVKRTLAFFGAIAFASASANDIDTESPFSLKGVQVGISMAEFKSIPVPIEFGRDGEEASRKRFNLPPLERTLTQECVKLARGLICQWVKIDKPPKGMSSSAMQVRTPVGGASGYFDFQFVTGLDGIERLAQIAVRSGNNQFGKLSAALIEKYGEPNQTVGEVENGYGATYDALTLSWANQTSEIVLKTRCGSIDDMCLTVSHLGLMSQLEQERQAVAKKNANDL
jgi:hypothetical protein